MLGEGLKSCSQCKVTRPALGIADSLEPERRGSWKYGLGLGLMALSDKLGLKTEVSGSLKSRCSSKWMVSPDVLSSMDLFVVWCLRNRSMV